MKYGVFTQYKNDAEKALERYAAWQTECEKWWAAHPDAEIGDDICEDLPACPLTTSAHMDAERVIELWNTVYTKLTDEDLALINTYPLYCPQDVRAWKPLKDKYNLSWNELRTMLRSMLNQN